MVESKEYKKEWRTPKIEVVNLKKYEGEIIANARSSCGCGTGCKWDIGQLPCNCISN